MICIYCGSATKIVNTRNFKKGLEKWRRHSCTTCYKIFTSRELPELNTAIKVTKRSGSHEPFYISKILISLYKALDHRTNAQQDSYLLAYSVFSQLLPNANKKINTSTIFEQTVAILKNFDPVGAVKYQSAQTPIMNKRDIRKAIR